MSFWGTQPVTLLLVYQAAGVKRISNLARPQLGELGSGL